MLKIGKGKLKLLAIVIGLVMILQTIVFAAGSTFWDDTEIPAQHSAGQFSEQDNLTALDISNMTGVSVDEIKKLKLEGKSWNEILEIIKNNPNYKVKDSNLLRDKTLLESGIGAEYAEKLKKEGFTDEDIIDARAIVERVVFQLQEITQKEDMLPQVQQPNGIDEVKKDSDNEAYLELLNKIDINKAVYLILKLKNHIGSMETVLDEYLCSIQLEIDLEAFIDNLDGYEKEKEKKLLEKNIIELINISKLEEDLILKVAERNSKDKDIIPSIPNVEQLADELQIENPLPEIKVPDVDDVKPKNPTEQLMQEINTIKSGGIDINGR